VSGRLLEGPVYFNLLSQKHLTIHLFDGLLSFLGSLKLDEGVAFDIPGPPVEVQVQVFDLPIRTKGILQVLLLRLLIDPCDAQNVALDRLGIGGGVCGGGIQ
jgi:hypothetical protein